MRATVLAGKDAPSGVADWLAATGAARRAVLFEGFGGALDLPPELPVTRLAAGCVCCLGQVPLRVGLTRLVRAHRPDELLLVLADGQHLARVRALLADGSLGVRFALA
jgi:hypothetical protein